MGHKNKEMSGIRIGKGLGHRNRVMSLKVVFHCSGLKVAESKWDFRIYS